MMNAKNHERRQGIIEKAERHWGNALGMTREEVHEKQLVYPGMFAMGKHGLGMVCFPMMVGSCILCFTLAGIFLLREKVRPLQLAALAMCLSGLTGLAMR